jgi:hypothetical protein
MADAYQTEEFNEDEFLAEVRKRFSEGATADRENREAGYDDLNFLAGHQWDDGVEEQRRLLGRPCLTINRLPQFVAQVVGDVRLNRPGIKVRPVEDADVDLAEVREGLIRSIENQSRAHAVYVKAATDQVSCGLGAFRVDIDYADADGFDRDLFIRPEQDPLALVWDPLSTDPTGADAKWCFAPVEMAREEFEKAYPDNVPSDLVASTMIDDWISSDTVRVTEYWVMKENPVILSLMPDGSTVEGEAEGAVRTRKSVRKVACFYLLAGHAVLEGPIEWPINRVPIIRAEGWVIQIARKRERFGLLRFAKDPQRLQNYWRSVSAETLALAPRSQWLASRDSLKGVEDDFRDAARAGDPLLIYTGQNAPQRMDPPPIPVALLQQAQMTEDDMKAVTGLHDASLGQRSNETSGRAILARQKEGDVATFIYHDNLKLAIAEAGRLLNDLIPLVYDTARTVRVLGIDEAPKVVRLNDPANPASIDIARGKYDVVVETGPSYSTRRVESAEAMTAFIQAVPQAAQVAGDLIAKAQDWPDAEAIAARLRKAMPPQLTEDPDNPEPPNPAMQQQAQMAQQAAMNEMGEAQAKTRQAVANADKAEAEAMKAQLELQQMQFAMGMPVDDFGQGPPIPEYAAAG